MLSRRTGLCMLLLCLLAGQGLTQPTTRPTMEPAAPVATQPAGLAAFRFAVIADPHIEKVDTVENLRRFLYTMKDRQVDFLVVLGDICSYMPDLLEQTGRVLGNSPLKVYAVPGNKDNDYGKDPDWYRAALGEPYYTFEHKGWRFVMYDSFNPPPDEWLAAQLSTPGPVIFCAHAPPDPRNLLAKGPWGELARRGNVKVALTGHWHRRATLPIGLTPVEVFKECFLRGRENPGTYYILEALPSGKVAIHEHSVTELNLREPPDGVPTVAIEPPGDGAVLHGTVAFRGTAGDDRGVQRVEYSIDWGRWRPAEGTSRWTAQVATDSLADGPHLLRVQAIDTSGQASLRLAKAVVATENHLAPGRVFRFQQGRDGYSGCTDATVKRFARAVNGVPGQPGDLQCWTWKKGQEEFNEFYIRFDLSGTRIPADAKIRRVSLTLYSCWQHSIDSAGKACRYFVGLPDEWKANVTFASRPARPGWLGRPQPAPALTGSWPRLPWWYLSTLPQPVVIDLTPIKDAVQQWLRAPASNHGLVFSPAAGQSYNMSARGSRYPDARFRPVLEIEIEGCAAGSQP